MTLETSTTAHVTDPSTGIQVKSGDASRTVVGMILTNGSAQFSEALTLSYFNRKPKVLSNSCAWGATPSAYPTWAELSNANRHTFIAWADDVVSTNLIGHIHGSGGTDSAAIGVAFDGIFPAMHIHANPTNSLIIPLTIVLTKTGLAENASHYATVSGWQHSGTSVSFGGTASGCGLFEVMVRG